MVGPLLDTKFHLPRRRRGGVSRPRLSDRLSAGLDVALTLVSAPPGFGKTTLLAEWLAIPTTDGRRVAWLSLDEGDNDPAVFWTYLVTALRTAVKNLAPDVGAAALAILQAPQSPIEVVLSSLLNDVNAVPADVVLMLVLDDYHVIHNRAVQDGMTFLLDHLPPQLHVVIAARADPALPLARLRSRGELVEIRSADLRFTSDEAAVYLTDHMGLMLTAGEVVALEARTEGWIAALQLAALSLHGRDDVTAFITDFAGDDRYIVDYLAEEVLNRQPDDVTRFLMQTSILERVCGPLCDAVTGRDDGKAMLATLEGRNLFLVPLDDRRRWYRYHQLFADVLQARLQDLERHSVAELHLRASQWFEQTDDPSPAIRHALIAGDFQRAAALAEAAIPEMGRTRQESAVLGWLAALPDDVVRLRPVLLVGFVGALLLAGRFEDVDQRLRDVERLLEAGRAEPEDASTRLTFVDGSRFHGLPGMIELYWAAIALAGGDVPGTIRHAERARELSAPDDALCRSAASGLSGLALWFSGDLDAAYAAYEACLTGLYRAGYVADTFGCAVALADIRVTQGRLGDALSLYEKTLEGASVHTGPILRGTADMYVGMSQVARERGDLPAATALLGRSQELGADAGLPQTPYRWRVAMAQIRLAEGDLTGALDLLDEAERLYNGDLFPDVRPIAAIRAGVWVAQGAVERAVGWAADRGLSADDDLTYLREFEHITLARILLARSATDGTSLQRGIELLGRLLVAAETGSRTGSVIEILVLQALANELVGDRSAAESSLGRAFGLGESNGYVSVFVNEGPVFAALLRRVEEHGTSTDHARRLVQATVATHPHLGDGAASPGPLTALSDRELDVLRLLDTELNGPAIARRLFVSLNTVRTHTKSIYAKLGVSNRQSAVKRARERRLL